MQTIYLSLGSNIGDRRANIEQAIRSLSVRGIEICRQSALYETEPVGFRGQDWFLNCIVKAETEGNPHDVMRQLLEIERSLGRERSVPNGPRIIDIDILLFGSEIIDEPDLKIPHPRMAERRFVLVPFAEIASDVRHPASGKTIAQLLAETKDRSEVKKL